MTLYQKRKFERGNLQGLGIWVFLIFAVGTYFLYMFLPPWYKSWQAKNLIKDELNGNSINGMDEDRMKERLVKVLGDKLKMNVTQADLRIEIRKQSQSVRVHGKWNAKIFYPFTKKFVKVKFDIGQRIKGTM